MGHGPARARRVPGRRAVTDVSRSVADHREVRRLAAERELPTIAVGHSLGGLVTAASAAVDPTGLSGVVLLGPALPDVPARPVLTAAALLGRLAPALQLRSRHTSLELLARRPGHVETTLADPLMTDGPLLAGTGASALRVAAALWAAAPSWRLPLLAVHGTGDQYTEWQGSRRLVDTVPSHDKTLRLVDGGYHELLDDLEGDTVLVEVLAWLDTRLG